MEIKMVNVNNILLDPQQIRLIESMARSIDAYSGKETIDCLISSFELHQEVLNDGSREHENINFLIDSLEAVSKLAEELSADCITRRQARDQFLIKIADIKVVA